MKDQLQEFYNDHRAESRRAEAAMYVLLMLIVVIPFMKIIAQHFIHIL